VIPFRTRRSDAVVGLFLVGGFLLLVATAVAVVRARHIFETRVHFYTVFKDSYGIAPGNTVTIASLDVGRVTDVRLTDEDRIEVHFDVRETFVGRVRADSVVEVQSPPGLGGIIGGTGLKISMGDQAKPVIAPGGFITGVDPMGMDEILAYFQDEQAGERGKAVLASIESLIHSLGAPDGPVQGILKDVAAVTQEVRGGEGRAGEVYAEVHRALRLINLLISDVRRQVAGAERILAGVESSAGHVEQALSGTPATVAKVNALLDGVGGLLAGVAVVLEDLKRVSAQASGASEEVPALLAEVDAQLKDLDVLMDGLRDSFLVRSLVEEPERPTALDPGLSDGGGRSP